MGRRRNSPGLQQIGSAFQRQIMGQMPPQPAQHDLAGMVTNERAEFAHGVVQARKVKAAEKKKVAHSFEFHMRSLGLPKPFGYINSAKEYSHEYAYCKDVGSTGLVPRDFRADYAWPEPQYRLLVELNGGIWIKGAHAHPLNIERDIIKYQYAAILGWHVLPVTTDDVKSGLAVDRLQRYFLSRGWQPQEQP